eukprot:10666217-Lingulodinium_polyedra.AAC.1
MKGRQRQTEAEVDTPELGLEQANLSPCPRRKRPLSFPLQQGGDVRRGGREGRAPRRGDGGRGGGP